METHWERGEPVRELSLDEISRLIAPAGFQARAARLIDEGKANTNYEVETTCHRKLLLRHHVREPKSANLERAVTDMLTGEVPVARVLLHDLSSNVSLLEWMPGKTMERLLSEGQSGEVASAAFDLGLALARMSQHVFPTSGFLSASPHEGQPLVVTDSWPSTVDGLFGYVEWLTHQKRVIDRAGRATTEAVRRLSEQCRPRMQEAVGPPCIVHGDFKASNLLIDEGRLSAVLDWEFVHSGTYLMSIGQIFRHRSTLPGDFETAFVEGYESEGAELPRDWRCLASVIDLLSMMSFLNRDSAGPILIAEVLGLTRSTLAAYAAAFGRD